MSMGLASWRKLSRLIMAIYISFATPAPHRGACVRFQRDLAEVTLLPVSKTFPAEALREA